MIDNIMEKCYNIILKYGGILSQLKINYEMEEKAIVSKMNEFLHQAANAILNWLGGLLPKITQDWWEECVLSKLSYSQREIAESKNFFKLSDFDLAALLRIADKNWYAMRNFAYLPTKERECIRAMQVVRNNWAHCSGSLQGKDLILQDLKTLLAFFEQLNSDVKITTEIEQFIKNVEASNFNDSIEKIIDIPTPKCTV